MKNSRLLFLVVLFFGHANLFAQNIIPVAAGTGTLAAAYATASAGDVLELTTSGGLYQEATTLIINKSITIKAAPSLANKPIWTADSGTYLIRTKASLTLIGVSLDGSKGVKKNVGAIATDSIGYNIKLTNCDFVNLINDAGTDGHAITDGIYSGQVDSLIITGCLFKNIQKQCIYFGGHTAPSISTVKYFYVTNSTFLRIYDDAIYLRDHDGSLTTPGPVFVVDHCTFYFAAAGYGVLAHYVDGAVVKNCIASYPTNLAKVAYYIYGDHSSLRNSLYFNLKINAHTAPTASLINADPLFVDTASNNFMVYKNSPAVNAGDDGSTIGDPRWGVSSQNAKQLVLLKKASSMTPTDSSIRIVWQTPEGASPASVVNFGTSKSIGSTLVGPDGWLIPGEGYMHEVTITGLQPFTKYYYRVGNGSDFSTDTNVTKTAPTKGTNFRLMSLSDIHENDAGIWKNLSDRSYRDSIDMMVFIGDFVNDGSVRTMWNSGFFAPGEKLMGTTPVISSTGNHETAFGPSVYYDYFSLPTHPANGEEPEAYYSMDYGDVKIIAINSTGNYSPAFNTGSQQLVWLEDQIKNATSKWIFIFSHTNVISTSYHAQWSGDEKAYLMPLYEKYAALGKHILVFAGDEHNFEHLYKAGVNYMRPGCANASLRETDLNLVDKPWSLFFKKTSGYSTIDVSDSGNVVTLLARDTSGTVFYSAAFSTSANQRPNIFISEPDGFDDETSDIFRIKWMDSDPDDNAKISLYYTTEISTPGTLLIDKISENDTTNYYDWDVSHMAPGSYYVYATISDSTNPPLTRFSSGKITIVKDSTAPLPVRNLAATVAQKKVFLTWKNPTQTLHLEKSLACFETGFDSCTGLNYGGSSGTLERITGYTGTGLRINYQIAIAWEQFSAILAIPGFPNIKSMPVLDFWYRGDGSSRSLRLIAEQDNDRNGVKDDWWYTESLTLSSTEWKHAVIDLRTLQPLSWHPNVDKTFDLENMASIDFIIPSADAGSGHIDIDEIKVVGDVSASPDFQGTSIVRKTVSYPTSHSDGTEVYRGSAEAYADSGLVVGQKYYYAAFAFDEVPNYSLLDTTSVTSATVVMGVKKGNELPTAYRLAQNYPNPFNPSTKIDFDLPEARHVSLTIYNSLGQEVANPLNQEFAAGYHAVMFEGLRLSTGVYYYKLEAGSFVSIKKMVLMK